MNIAPINNQRTYTPSFGHIALAGDVKNWLKRDIRLRIKDIEALGGSFEMIGERLLGQSGSAQFRIKRKDNHKYTDVFLHKKDNPLQKIKDAVTELIRTQ